MDFEFIIGFVKHLHRCRLAAKIRLHQQPTLDEDKLNLSIRQSKLLKIVKPYARLECKPGTVLPEIMHIGLP